MSGQCSRAKYPGSVCTASWSKPEARLGESAIEQRGKDLRNGLLDDPISDRRDPQQSDPSAFWLRDLDSPYWRGLVAAIEQGSADVGPVFPREDREVIDGHPIDAGSTPVGLHSLPSSTQVRWRHHPRHEVVVQGWLHGLTPYPGSPGRVRHRVRVTHRSALSHRVRAFGVGPFLVRSPPMPSADFCTFTQRVAALRAAGKAALGSGGQSGAFTPGLSPAPLTTPDRIPCRSPRIRT